MWIIGACQTNEWPAVLSIKCNDDPLIFFIRLRWINICNFLFHFFSLWFEFYCLSTDRKLLHLKLIIIIIIIIIIILCNKQKLTQLKMNYYDYSFFILCNRQNITELQINNSNYYYIKFITLSNKQKFTKLKINHYFYYYIV